MATNTLETKTDICNAALALLRQDIGYKTSPSIAAKCDAVWTVAYDALANVHEWSEGVTVGDEVPASSMLRHLLVYALARELAIPVTGRQEDLKTISDLYEKKLVDAIAKDLQDETDALRLDETDEGRFNCEVLDLLKQYYSTGDTTNSYGRTKCFPRSVASLVRHIESVKETVRKEVLLSHDWSFATAERPACSISAPDGRYMTSFPADAVKLVKCFSDVGEKAETVVREGAWLFSRLPIVSIVYIFDTENISDWTLLARRAYLYKMSEVLAMANPELVGNPDRLRQLSNAARSAIEEARTADTRQSHTATSAYGRNYLFDVATGRRQAKWRGERGKHLAPHAHPGGFRHG